MYAGVPNTSPVLRERGASDCSSRARPKSSTTGAPSRVDHDVAGLHVAVDDAGLVRGVQRARGVLEERSTRRSSSGVRGGQARVAGVASSRVDAPPVARADACARASDVCASVRPST